MSSYSLPDTGALRRPVEPGQYLSIVYTERLAAEGAVTSVGSKGDSYDNAMAESINGLYKGECITMEGPWRTVDDVELATLSWVHWWNNERILEPIGDVPPIEFEAMWRDGRENEALRSPQSDGKMRSGIIVPSNTESGNPAGLVTQ